MSFSIRYAVPMHGPGCQRSVTTKIESLENVDKVDVDLAKQEVVIEGSVAPSAVVEAMQTIGRDAFVRGSGQPNSAAVAILETNEGKVEGLARLIEVAKGTTLFDISVDKAHAGTNAAVYSFGDISNPPQTLGAKLFSIIGLPVPAKKEPLTISAWSTHTNTPLANLIGRSIHTESGLTGIIARSAGLFENDKSVCTCSGKTSWQERADFRANTNGHL